MKEGWVETTISDIAEVARGGSPRPIKSFITDGPGGVNWIKIGDTEKGGRYIESTAEKIKPEGIRSSRWVEEGDFLLSNSMSFGRPYILKTSGCIHDGWLVLRPDYTLVDQGYLYYVLSSPSVFQQFDSRAAGSTVRNLNIDLVSGVTISLPPLDEQKRIVAKLDQAFAALDRARAHAEANLADAHELLGNALNSLFVELSHSTDAIPLEDAAHSNCSLSYGIVQPGDDVEDGLPVVRPVNLKQRVITPESLKKISPDRANGYARTRLVGGELLLCVRGSTGEVSVAARELEGANVTRGIVPIRFDPDKVLPEFAYFQFRSNFIRDQIVAKTYGAALMQINIKDLRKLSFIVPTIAVQQECAARAERMLDHTTRLCAAYDAALTDLAALRQSLLQQAFSGQLT